MKYRAEIDILRALSISAVVIIHMISDLGISLVENPLLLYVNQVARFSVPLFVMLSGYGLSKKYEGRDVKLSEFWQRRAWKILPMYLWWSVILYALWWIILPWREEINYPLPVAILLGKVDYHMYFIPMIFQLYLAFPLMKKVKNKMNDVWYVIVFGGIQLLSFVMSQYLGWSDQIAYTIALNWIGYFAIGVMLGEGKWDNFRITSYKGVYGGMIGVVILSLINYMDSVSLVQKGFNELDATRFTRFSVYGFAIASSIYLVGIREKLNKWPRKLWLVSVWLGKRSYLIFLSHTVWIRMVVDLYRDKINGGQFVLTLIVMVLGWRLSSSKFRIR